MGGKEKWEMGEEEYKGRRNTEGKYRPTWTVCDRVPYPLGLIAPKGAGLTLSCFVASHFAMPFPRELTLLLAVC